MQTVVIVKTFVELLFQSMEFGGHIRQFGDGIGGEFEQFTLGSSRWQHLPQNTDAVIFGQSHRSVVGRYIPRHDAEQGRFARPVGADYADTVAGVDTETYFVEDRFPAITFGYIFEVDRGKTEILFCRVLRQFKETTESGFTGLAYAVVHTLIAEAEKRRAE